MNGILRLLLNSSLTVGAAALLADGEMQGMGTGDWYHDDKATANSVLAAGALLWPVAFDAIVGYDKIGTLPTIGLGFCIPLVLGMFNLAGPRSVHCDKATNDADRRVEAQSIIQAAFAAGILLFNSSDGFLQQRGIRIIMFAILMCVAAVIPQGILGNGISGERIVLQAAQRVTLNWSIGLIVVGMLTAVPSQVKTWDRARARARAKPITSL